MKKFILCLTLLISSSGLGWADSITFEATVNSSQISLDDVLQLTLTFTGVHQDLNPVSLPAVDGFSSRYLGPSSSVSIVNGVYSSSLSFIYNLFPSKVGQFQIPPITATIAGQVYKTKPIDVQVFQSASQAQQASASSQPTDQGQAPSTQSFKDKILLIATVDKTDVYLNERVPLTIKLLINGLPMRDIQYPQFDKTSVLVDDFDKPEQSSEIVNGIKYDSVTFKTSIYPNRLGRIDLGPLQTQGNVLYKTGENNPFAGDSDFMGGNMFNGLFDSYATRPVTVTSKPIILNVSPLPQENRPDDFSGAIGQFDFQASVSPLQVNAGDPLTLKMDVQGSGNFKSVKIPDFESSGFKAYAPQIKNTGSEKNAEEVIIPTSVDIKQVPALHFSYFDTSIKDYRTITQGPFAIQVKTPNPEQEFKAVGFANLNKEGLAGSANQFSWGKIFNKIYRILEKLYRSIWCWVSLGIILLAWISYSWWRRFQDRLLNDPAFARRMKALKEAKQALNQAEGYMIKDQVKDFYALLSKVLRDYLANKWHQPSAALNIDKILGRLKTAKLDEVHVEKVKVLLEQSDLVCFAGVSRDATQMRADLTLTRSIIDYLQQHLK